MLLRFRTLAFGLLLPVLASCSGGSQQTSPAVQAPPPQTFTVGQEGSATASITLRTTSALPASALSLVSSSCSSTTAIKLFNPFPFPLTIHIDSFTVRLWCAPQSPLFGATFYQIRPQPDPLSPIKLGDASANGSTLTFNAVVKTLTLPPRTYSQITVLPETSTSEVAFPVVPGTTTNLTSSSTNLPSQLSFVYKNSSGAQMYTAACFNAFNDGVLAPALQGVPLVGIPSFYCHIATPNGAVVTFGQLVKFTIGTPKPDRSIFEPDGTAQGFACTLASDCNVPQFSVPSTYQNFIAGNVQDLRLCAPATANVDCNGVTGDTQGAAQTSVPAGREFQVLVADDSTYKPGTPSAPVPWDGLFRMQLSGPCALETTDDPDEGHEPPLYTDAQQTGVGPNAEFDVVTTGPGTCSITASEDGRYITDYTDPANPQPRSATLAVTVTAPSY